MGLYFNGYLTAKQLRLGRCWIA